MDTDKELIELLRPLSELGKRHLATILEKEQAERLAEQARRMEYDKLHVQRRADRLIKSQLVKETARRLNATEVSVSNFMEKLLQAAYDTAPPMLGCDPLRHCSFESIIMNRTLGLAFDELTKLRGSKVGEIADALRELPDDFSFFQKAHRAVYKFPKKGEKKEGKPRGFWHWLFG